MSANPFALYEHMKGSLQGTAKSLEGPTIAKHPNLHQYQFQYGLRESETVKALREKIEASEYGRLASSPDESQFLAMLCELLGAKKVVGMTMLLKILRRIFESISFIYHFLEVGIFMGYTTLAIAEKLPQDGKIYALDVNAEWAGIGKNLCVSTTNSNHRTRILEKSWCE